MDVETDWTEHLRSLLSGYDEPLLRQVADNLLRSRLQRTPADLIEKMAEAAGNPVVIDRRLRLLDAPQRGFLALLGLSRQSVWPLAGLLELLSCTDAADGLAAVRQLLEAGLLYVDPQQQSSAPLQSFDDWLPRGFANGFRVFAPPGITGRAAHLASGGRQPPDDAALLPDTAAMPDDMRVPPGGAVRETDGLELFLRLGALWQQVHATPLRLTQQGDFFKRDHDRLTADALLTGAAADELHAPPQMGHFLVGLALELGILRREEGQIVAGQLPATWHDGLVAALTQVWSALPRLGAWNAAEGWRGLNGAAVPYASARLAAIGLLANLNGESWVAPETVGEWLATHHCYWRENAAARKDLANWSRAFLLGIAYPLRLVQAAQDDKKHWRVRLSPTGRAVLGLGPPTAQAAFPKTLLVQPNLEILAYRQGLTPGLAAALSQFCAWQSLGAACTLRLQPETVYRGLETGLALEAMVRLLQQHGVRDLPPGVLDSLRTWANKRDRITVHTAATLLEFPSADDAQAALGRGLAGLRITDRLVLVVQESDIDFRQFRLVGTRDYALPPGQCVEVAADGVTLAVDPARSDLLLDTEIQRFAQLLSPNGVDRRTYRLTPGSLGRGKDAGVTLRTLEEWFLQRAGQPLSPAARLLLGGAETPPLRMHRLLVVEVPSPLLADGLVQWPETRALIRDRLGPQALVVEEQNVEALRAKMRDLRLQVEG